MRLWGHCVGLKDLFQASSGWQWSGEGGSPPLEKRAASMGAASADSSRQLETTGHFSGLRWIW